MDDNAIVAGIDEDLQGLAELRTLQQLMVLNVAENQVSRIPIDFLRHLSHLKALVLNNNSITTLEWIPKLSVRCRIDAFDHVGHGADLSCVRN